MKIAIDFDGTVVAHEYPKIGKDIGAVPILKRLVNNGHLLILNTMRSGEQLQEAIRWFSDNRIALYGVNRDPGQEKWTKSSKVFAHLYIDDLSLGCPLKFDADICNRPFVDWVLINEWMIQTNILPISKKGRE
jgi:hypothetical protein